MIRALPLLSIIYIFTRYNLIKLKTGGPAFLCENFTMCLFQDTSSTRCEEKDLTYGRQKGGKNKENLNKRKKGREG